jgi:hypothetical protein
MILDYYAASFSTASRHAASFSLRQLRYDCHYAIFAFHYAAIIFHYFLSRLFSFDIAIVIDYY